MPYLDTSCLLKLLRDEPESQIVRGAVDAEEVVVISSLAELEAEVELKAAFEGGRNRLSQWRYFQARLLAMRNFEPFQFRHFPASVFSTAMRQHRRPQAYYCRTLDRLHLAAMEELSVNSLMTLDKVQAEAAAALGFRVIRPG